MNKRFSDETCCSDCRIFILNDCHRYYYQRNGVINLQKTVTVGMQDGNPVTFFDPDPFQVSREAAQASEKFLIGPSAVTADDRLFAGEELASLLQRVGQKHLVTSIRNGKSGFPAAHQHFNPLSMDSAVPGSFFKDFRRFNIIMIIRFLRTSLFHLQLFTPYYV
jgi:hypothetical protein